MIEDADPGPLERAVTALSLDALGLRGAGPGRRLPTGPGHRRRSVLRVRVLGPASGRIVLKYAINPTDDEERSLRWEHTVTSVLHSIARAASPCPLPAPLTSQPLDALIAIPSGGKTSIRVVISARQYVEAGPNHLTPRAIGQLIARLHQLGTHPAALNLLASRPANVLAGLDPEILARTVAAPEHPFRTQKQILTTLFTTLEQRVAHARELDPHPLLAHRDLHPLNCVSAVAGPVALDWAEAGWGSRSDDFAWLHLAVARYGAPRRVLGEALAGYADVLPRLTPTREQVSAAGRVRELVCLAFSLQNAARDPAHRREAHLGLPILAAPDAPTPRWTALFNPGIFTHPVFAEPALPTEPALSPRTPPATGTSRPGSGRPRPRRSGAPAAST